MAIPADVVSAGIEKLGIGYKDNDDKREKELFVGNELRLCNEHRYGVFGGEDNGDGGGANRRKTRAFHVRSRR